MAFKPPIITRLGEEKGQGLVLCGRDTSRPRPSMWFLPIELKSHQYKSTVLSVCLLSHIDCIARCLIVMFFNFSGFLELLKILQLVSLSCFSFIKIGNPAADL